MLVIQREGKVINRKEMEKRGLGEGFFLLSTEIVLGYYDYI